ncbi:uncharacterized protein PRD47_002357 isoform 2-T2 [Ara ararauna]
MEQEEQEALVPASDGCVEQEAETEAQRNTFALLSPTALELAHQETARCLVSDVLHKALGVIQEMDEQPQEQQDNDESHVDVSKGAMRPAAVEDVETAVAAEPQAEASMDTKPGAPPTLAGAAEEEERCAPTAAMEQQEIDIYVFSNWGPEMKSLQRKFATSVETVEG